MECLREDEEGRCGYDNGADIHDTIANRQLDIQETMPNDRMRNDRNHQHPKERPVWAEPGCVENKGDEEIGDSRSEGGDQDGREQIANLELLESDQRSEFPYEDEQAC